MEIPGGSSSCGNMRLFQRTSQSRSWRYNWGAGEESEGWILLLESGIWHKIHLRDGIKRPIEPSWAADSKYYFYYGRWKDLRDHPNFDKVIQWQTLSMRLLPYWDHILERGVLPAKTLKQWSNLGVTRRYGDVCNDTMSLIVEMALEINNQTGVPACPYIQYRNREKQADILEAVMGLRDL